MAVTSKRVARQASRVMRNKRSSRDATSVAASALRQVRRRPAKRRRRGRR